MHWSPAVSKDWGPELPYSPNHAAVPSTQVRRVFRCRITKHWERTENILIPAWLPSDSQQFCNGSDMWSDLRKYTLKFYVFVSAFHLDLLPPALVPLKPRLVPEQQYQLRSNASWFHNFFSANRKLLHTSCSPRVRPSILAAQMNEIL